MCGRWVTARQSLGRTAARIQRSRSTPCARRDSSRTTSDASSTGAPQPRSSFNHSAPWRRSGIRVLLRASSASPSPGSPPGGSAGRTTCSRCRAGIGGFASSSTGRWRCSSGRTLPKWSCASSGSRSVPGQRTRHADAARTFSAFVRSAVRLRTGCAVEAQATVESRRQAGHRQNEDDIFVRAPSMPCCRSPTRGGSQPLPRTPRTSPA